MPFEMKRNAQFHLISTPAIITGTFTDTAGVTAAMLANAIPGVTDFGYDHELGVERRGKGQFGVNKPVGLTDEYGGIKGSFDVEGTDGEQAVLAAINRVDREDYINANYNALKQFWLVANEYRDGIPKHGYFVGPCKLDALPRKIGPNAKLFGFQSLDAQDFIEKQVYITTAHGGQHWDVGLTGAYDPVADSTVLFVGFPVQAYEIHDGNYALLVLRSNESEVRELTPGQENLRGLFIEDSSGILLSSADALTSESDKLLVVFVRS